MGQSIKTGGLLMAAVAFAGLAGWGALQYLEQREAELRNAAESLGGPSVEVVVAAMPAEIGTTISLENMAIADIPAMYLPQDAITPAQFQEVAGRALVVGLDEGRPLLRSYISGLSHVNSFADLLPVGERAITLEVDELNATAGMLQAGDRIDLLLMPEAEEEGSAQSGPHLHKLMENVTVLATGNLTQSDAEFAKAAGVYPDSPFYGTVTIGVPVYQVTDVLMAREKGQLHVLLRNTGDDGFAAYPGHDRLNSGPGSSIESMAGGVADNGMLQVERKNADGLRGGAIGNAAGERRLPQRFLASDL
ncbi:Flp pilus assembly protein CpaB [Marinobacter salicampi]|uniref:Flp pilus assembly protein CpaB n=1 Tax=Marinobacter salicampi TaxID=435907 RepID=UPI001407B750|nr:Flp pilus assembly protein CpaB [Marinobacter salicampi]